MEPIIDHQKTTNTILCTNKYESEVKK